MNKPLIAVGMSGGVDSSVSAYLLKKQGFRVIGLFMKNWEEANGPCSSVQDAEDAAEVCAKLQIPFYTLNFVQEYRDRVFKQFLEECQAGLTPNPDILCNREIKFEVFLKKSLELGADFVATGHYCRTNPEKTTLLKGLDPEKDQSYFLHAISKQALQRTLFPIGHLHKAEVRKIAKQAELPTFQKKDSTGICFIGERNFKQFLGQYLGFQKGPFLTLSGEKVGEHDGIAYYTIGQRKGLKLGGEGEAWYVLGKDLKKNAILVERGANHPALFKDRLIASEPTWISKPNTFPFQCKAKIRYRQTETTCTLISTENNWIVSFETPQRAISPGQSVVFYDGDCCLGGAVIKSTEPALQLTST